MALPVIGGMQAKWICEFCYTMSFNNKLPTTWVLVLRCAVCPECRERIAADGGYEVVEAGAYADAPDPRR